MINIFNQEFKKIVLSERNKLKTNKKNKKKNKPYAKSQ